jgi:hypothetical protein
MHSQTLPSAGFDLERANGQMSAFKNQVSKSVEDMDRAGRTSWACLSDSRALLASVDERLVERRPSSGVREHDTSI